MTTARVNFFLLVLFGLTLPAGVVLSTHLARRSFERVKLRDQVITVKGYAERPIVSDRATWSGHISARAAEIAPAYAQLEKHRASLMGFLAERGFKDDSVEQSPVGITVLHERNKEGEDTNRIEGYVLTQGFAIASQDVTRVAAVARDASALIRQGIELESDAPQFLYTKLNDVKMEMLSEATANARKRAEQLLTHSTSRLGPLRAANQGVFQITAPDSTEVTGSGVNDTESLQKMIRAVVTVEYAIVE